jgi:hypothetical protein
MGAMWNLILACCVMEMTNLFGQRVWNDCLWRPIIMYLQNQCRIIYIKTMITAQSKIMSGNSEIMLISVSLIVDSMLNQLNPIMAVTQT